LFIEVNKIPRQGLEINRSLQLPPVLMAGGDAAPVEEVRLAGVLSPSSGDLVFRGSVEAVVSLTCSRCLVPFPYSLRESCHRIFRSGTLGRRESKELSEEDWALTSFDGARIDLSELAREQIYLLLPLKPLCKESCVGLCPRCGASRNVTPCGCPEVGPEAEPLTLKIPL